MSKNKYKTKDLTIGILGVIDYKSPNEIYWKKKKAMPYIVYETIEDNVIKGATLGEDILTGDTYYFFNKGYKRKEVLKASNHKCAIISDKPVSMCNRNEYIDTSEIERMVSVLNIDNALLKIKDDILLKLKDGFNKLGLIYNYDAIKDYTSKLSFLTDIYINILAYPREELEETYQTITLEILNTSEEIDSLFKKNKKKIKKL